MPKAPADQYGKKEAKDRFEAALRGSRNVGPKPMKDMASKRDKDPMPGKRNIKND
jgi:hypothetical protein